MDKYKVLIIWAMIYLMKIRKSQILYKFWNCGTNNHFKRKVIQNLVENIYRFLPYSSIWQ